MEYKGFRDLIVFQKSYKLALEIFEITKKFPPEEKYSLTDQIRRSSRSVPQNIGESWYKRKYPKAFINKLSDAIGEAAETEVWIDFSKDFSYIDIESHNYFVEKYEEVCRMLQSMINNPEKFCK
ncbi:MAG: four helix bundle protein [Bacteroidetes bacterium]|nr:four helix bundle protein [Bacteroidota bacterium]